MGFLSPLFVLGLAVVPVAVAPPATGSIEVVGPLHTATVDCVSHAPTAAIEEV